MALKRDSKGRFLKRGSGGKKKRRASKKANPRKRKAGLKGHKPGCRCVIHARRRRVTRRARPATRARVVRANMRRRKPSLFRRVVSGAVAEIRLSAKETKDFGSGGMTWDRVYARAAKVLRGKQKGTVLVRSASGKILTRFSRRKGSTEMHQSR